jgi:two-component system OmpR family response regulator
VRVLVVEDEPGIAQALVRGLTADGFTVDHADDGTEGLWLAQTNPYAAIILDLMLPGTNGWVICATLRQAGDTTPILMLTAKDGEYDEIEGLETGADDFMTKPFSYPVLVTRLRALLRRSGSNPADATLSAGDLVLDPRGRVVRRGDTDIELSPRAFSVLEYMMAQAGLVVSKQSILANVWDHAFEGDPNIVEVYVSRIRNAVDVPFGRKAIETVRGVGYRLARDGG